MLAHPVLAAVVPVAVGLAAVVLAAIVLRLLPEPPPEPVESGPGVQRIEDKPTYRSLVRPSLLIMVGVLALFVTLTAVLRLDPSRWSAWIVLALVGTVLAMIDAATTWLPNAVMYPFWVLMAVAALITFTLAGGRAAVAMVVGGLVWMILFWLVWVVSRRQIGFGDVRFALGLGAAAGSAGWTTIYTCLLAGTMIGAGWGLVHRLRHGRAAGSFAYGMALFLGCGVGLAVTPL